MFEAATNILSLFASLFLTSVDAVNALEAKDPTPPAIKAIYSVPVKEEQLKEFASFQLKIISFQKSDGILAVTYQLPQELIGDEVRVSFSGKMNSDESGLLAGENGQMNCNSYLPGGSCFVLYKNISVDMTKTTAYLKSISRSEQELTSRLRVASEFGGDPVGIIKFSAE